MKTFLMWLAWFGTMGATFGAVLMMDHYLNGEYDGQIIHGKPQARYQIDTPAIDRWRHNKN